MGLLEMGGDLFGGWLNNSAANQRQVDANNFSANQYASRWQTTTKDMEAAGLNPMLAYSQGVGNSPSGAIASSAGFSTQLGTNSAIANNQNASAAQAYAQVGLIDQTVSKVVADTTNTNADTQRISTLIDNLEVQRSNLIKEGYNLTEQGNVMRATISKLEAEVPWLTAQTVQSYAQSYLTDTNTSLGRLDLKAGESMNNLGRNTQQFKPIVDLILGVLRGGSHFR